MTEGKRERKLIIDDDKLQQCTECGGSYRFLGQGKYACENCGKIEYNDFGKVKLFLEENGPSPAVVISEGTGVPITKIMEYIRQGRIRF